MQLKEYTKSLYSANEAAEILGVNLRTLYRYIKNGTLKGAKWGSRWHFTEQNLRDFMNIGAGQDTENE